MNVRIFSLFAALWIAYPAMGQEATNSSHIVGPEWVWRNGKLVMIPQRDRSPIKKEAVASANQINVQWSKTDSGVAARVEVPEPTPPKAFDPLLSKTPVAPRGYLKTPRFSGPKKLDDHTLIKPKFRDGRLPPKVSLENEDVDPQETEEQMSTTASTRNMSPSEVQRWGAMLQRKSIDLKKRYAKLKNAKDDIDRQALQEYVKESQKLQEDLSLYREQVQRLQNQR